jgi:hypothetical protein
VSSVLVLEDAILEQSGELPDELCPVLLAQLGLELGGHAAVVGRHILQSTGFTEALEVYEEFVPEHLWAELCARRTFKDKPFTGLKLAEVYSAVHWHLQGMAQLQQVGLCQIEAESWQWCRTLYDSRDGGVFELRHNGECCWRTEKSKEVQRLDVPVLSKIRRDLVVRPADGRRLDPRLKDAGWTANATNLRRARPWPEHSRKKRARALEKAQQAGPPLPKKPHRWGPGERSDVERCARCDVARFLATGRVSVYRYAVGTPEEVEEARAWARVLRQPPRCETKEGT